MEPSSKIQNREIPEVYGCLIQARVKSTFTYDDTTQRHPFSDAFFIDLTGLTFLG